MVSLERFGESNEDVERACRHAHLFFPSVVNLLVVESVVYSYNHRFLNQKPCLHTKQINPTPFEIHLIGYIWLISLVVRGTWYSIRVDIVELNLS